MTKLDSKGQSPFLTTITWWLLKCQLGISHSFKLGFLNRSLVVRLWWFLLSKYLSVWSLLAPEKTICTMMICGTKTMCKQKKVHTEREKGGKGVDRKSEAGGAKKWLPTPVFTFFLHFPKTLPCRLAVTLVPHAEIRQAMGKWIIYMGLPFRIKVSTMRLPQREQKGTRELRANTLRATNTGTHT